MKLEKLILHNIASFEDAEIDFDQQPLVDSDVFLITGKTGAGKSTILDAICLALYATTPRLNSTKMQGEAESVQIDDPRQLMRKNTVEAFVSLIFTGGNGVHYQATWEVHRADKKATGTLQQKKWKLEFLDKPLPLGKDNKIKYASLEKDVEIKTEINAAIGLDFNQFCRTTMLAQGEFTRFLNSKDDEKAQILEKITGVDAYSKIGRKIYEETGHKENEWKSAQILVDGVKTLSQEEIEEKKEELARIRKQSEVIQAEQDAAKVKRQWIVDDKDFSEKFEKAKKEHQAALEVLDSADYKEKEQLVKDWNDTVEARSKLSELNAAKRQKTQQETELGQLAVEYGKLLEGQQYANEELRKLEDGQAAVDAYIHENESKKGIYENVQTIVGHLAAIADGRKNIADNEKKRVDKENKLNKVLIPSQQQAEKCAKEAEDELKKKESELKIQEEELKKKNLPTLRSERDAAIALLSRITVAKDRIDAVCKAKTDIQNRRIQNDSLKGQIDENQKDSDLLKSRIHDADIIQGTCKDNLDKQRDTVDKFAKTLRAKLKKGDVCPVCGQAIAAELPQEEALSALVEGLQEAFNKAKKEYDDLVAAKNKLDAQINTDSVRYNGEKKAIEEDKSVAEAEGKALSACNACGINVLDVSALDSLESHTNDTITALNGKIQSGESQEQIVEGIRKDVEKHRKLKETADENFRKENKAVDDCRGEIMTSQSLIDSKKEEVKKAEGEVETRVCGITWNIDWHNNPEVFGDALTKDAQVYNSKVTEQANLVSSIKTKKREIDDVSKALKTILDTIPEWVRITPQTVCRIEELLDKTNRLAQKVAAILTTLKTAENTIRINDGWFDAFLMKKPSLNKQRIADLSGHTPKEIEVLNGSLQKIVQNELTKRTELGVAQKTLDEHNGKRPVLDTGDTLATLEDFIKSGSNQILELNQQIGAINKELNDDVENKKNLGQLMKDAADKKALYEKWNRLNQLIGDATGSKFRRIAQSYVLANLIHSANSYMATLTDRYILKVIPGTFVISVEDAYQGYASRAASTISGGESFLVSLSLALALSDIGQNLSVDTIFIDEGFGTLSGEPLQNAIETLRSLHTKAGRHVGIISHVEELQEKIPVQIQVCQDNKTSSSMIHVVPDSNNAKHADLSTLSILGL